MPDFNLATALGKTKVVIASVLFVWLLVAFGVIGHSVYSAYSAYCANTPVDQVGKWQHGFWCDFKFTDFIVAFFSLVLALVTAGLMFMTHVPTCLLARLPCGTENILKSLE